MIFNEHSRFKGMHAFLSASKYHWINYDEEKLLRTFGLSQAAQRGTELHALAHEMIRLGIKAQATKKTFNMYVNDCIGYGMEPEQVLFFSEFCFGTADALSFKRNKLRVFDLKTGFSPASVHQLEIYAALFCLEYHFSPFEIEIEMRIYQNDQVDIYEADADVIIHIMEKIKLFNRIIEASVKGESL